MSYKKQLKDKLIKSATHNSNYYFYSMYQDQQRNLYYEDIIQRKVKDKVVLEIGAGIGLLSVLCIKHQAKHVYALEINKSAFYALKETIKKNGLQDKITPLNISSLEFEEVNILKSIDIVLHELISDSIFGESVLTILKDIQKKISSNAIFLPQQLEVKAVGITLKDLELKDTKVCDIESFLPEKFYINKEDIKSLSDKTYSLFEIDFHTNFSYEQSIHLNRKEFDSYHFFALYFKLTTEQTSLSSLNSNSSYSAKHWKIPIFKIKDSSSISVKYTLNNIIVEFD